MRGSRRSQGIAKESDSIAIKLPLNLYAEAQARYIKMLWVQAAIVLVSFAVFLSGAVLQIRGYNTLADSLSAFGAFGIFINLFTFPTCVMSDREGNRLDVYNGTLYLTRSTVDTLQAKSNAAEGE